MTQTENLVAWLRDAHAMEKQAETMLNAQSSRIENYPEVKKRIEEHLKETQSQAERIEGCLKSLGASSSGMKDMGGKTTAMMQGLGGMFTSDEVIKGAMASYAFEHFEISAYTALVAAAEELGETQVADTCREILKEEEAMASWLAEHLPGVTKAYLERQAGGQTAKR
ncbi:ferritin-like domain-containing protein [Afifella sp. JA880]|uniref:ferritin-like domain-containing protein n=1 Tax=Afifella sp. JA880 TaxID=2975280 RepID=UPI0021BB8ECC|nr:ferritin-like domain-containing protein [Afifella sp. JA880]MCT8266294.1 ferritin-like domain-containing protein [Afifella sp. JA880]